MFGKYLSVYGHIINMLLFYDNESESAKESGELILPYVSPRNVDRV